MLITKVNKLAYDILESYILSLLKNKLAVSMIH